MGLISRVSSRTYRNRKKKQTKKIMARQEVMTLRGTLEGHGGWVTQIATNPMYPDMLISSSRDKTLIIWQLNRDGEAYGHPMKRLKGHNHFVSDVVVSSCGQFAVSASWDKTLRLWDLERGITTTRSPATSTTFSPSPSPPTTDRSSPPAETRPSSSGTLWASSSGARRARTATTSGLAPSSSRQPPRTQSSSPAPGTRP